LKVIAEAKKILVETTGGAAEQTYSFVQLSQHHAQTRIVSFMKQLAKRHHSAALAQLSSRIAAVLRFETGARGPFDKVKNLIETMITKLEKEGDEAATEKAWCDEQTSKTKAKKDDLEEDEEKLSTKIDQASSASKTLKKQVKQLQSDLGALTKEQAEMDTIRQEENAAYKEVKADLELGLSGVERALTVLRDYYAKDTDSDDSGAFVQQPAPPVSHGKAEGAGNSIIGILEVCQSDFAEGLAKAEAEESDAQAVYDKTTQENKVVKATKEQDVKGKTNEFTALDKTIAELSSDLDSVNEELGAVNEYFAKVNERCIVKPESYEERKARREAEINGLKEALSILENDTAFVQRTRRHVRGALVHS
jgi:chromosome segregation ATPase